MVVAKLLPQNQDDFFESSFFVFAEGFGQLVAVWQPFKSRVSDTPKGIRAQRVRGVRVVRGARETRGCGDSEGGQGATELRVVKGC